MHKVNLEYNLYQCFLIMSHEDWKKIYRHYQLMKALEKKED